MFDQAQIIITDTLKEKLIKQAEKARKAGKFGIWRRVQALLAVSTGIPNDHIASTLRCTVRSIQNWLKDFIIKGLASLKRRESSGRPPKLTKTEKRELGEMIDAGPAANDYPGACWRSPMIQDLIQKKFGKVYSAKYIAELLKNMGFTFQKATFQSAHLNEEKRNEWLEETWPEIQALSKNKNALIMFGDEVSFPMWGSLSYTWSRRGCQPTIKTSGKRKGHKVFGLICYGNGKFYSSSIEGRFNSESYIAFLKEVLSKNKQHIILIQDGARYHTSKKTKEFFQCKKDKLTVFQLPSYSPDYNPIEKLWKKIKQSHIHLQYFPTFEDLKNKVQEALLEYSNLHEDVLTLFGFYRNRCSA